MAFLPFAQGLRALVAIAGWSFSGGLSCCVPQWWGQLRWAPRGLGLPPRAGSLRCPKFRPFGKGHGGPLGLGDAGGTRDGKGLRDVLGVEGRRVWEHLAGGGHPILQLSPPQQWDACGRRGQDLGLPELTPGPGTHSGTLGQGLMQQDCPWDCFPGRRL